MSTRPRALAFALLLLPAIAACSATGGPATSPDAGGPSSAPSSGGGKGPDYDYGGVASPSAVASEPAGGGEAVEVGTGSGALGTYLTGAGGMTLYIFTKDSAGSSVCDGECATNWPPLVVPDGGTVTGADGVSGALTTFARSDGSMQVAYDGKPLYYFIADKAPGDTEGQGVNDVWFIAEP